MRLLIGLDPDVKQSGFAAYDLDRKDVRNRFVEIRSLSFYDVEIWLKVSKRFIECVNISAGWLIKKTNWHGIKGIGVREKVAMQIGRNHQVGILLAEFCEREGIPYKLIKPTGKVSDEYFKSLCDWTGKTNQDERDAAMLVVGM